MYSQNQEETDNKYKSHCSWNNENLDLDDVHNKIKIYQQHLKKDKYAINYQYDMIPVYDVKNIDLSDENILTSIYENFYNEAGVLIIKNAYSKEIMEEYNKWSFKILGDAKNDKNCRHPKQNGKYLINDIIGRMTTTEPELLMELINNKNLTTLIDLLLGFAKYGSVTGHLISAGGDRQQSHVDYPTHIGSGAFWENSIEKFKNLTTNYQVNHILPYYSVQVLISTCYMDVKNGSTEVVPCSHLLKDIDLLIHDKKIYNYFEKLFVNVTLDKGDILIFNRRLCHRGGKNLSSNPRNSLILQCVWMWGIGQEIIEYEKIIKHIEKTNYYNNLSEYEKEKFKMRLKAPYPIDVKKNT